jgi:hypothetical protein
MYKVQVEVQQNTEGGRVPISLLGGIEGGLHVVYVLLGHRLAPLLHVLRL